MWTLHNEIQRAARELDLGNERFHRLDEHREHKVLQDVKRHFLTDAEAVRWWECFRYPAESRRFRNPRKLLPDLCPNDGKKIWFIPCGHDEGVYDTLPDVAMRVLAACLVFTYAVVDKKLEWMLLENRLGLMFATGEKAINRLREMRAENQSTTR